MRIRFADAADHATIERFNARLRAAGRREQLPLDPALTGEMASESHTGIHRRLMIAEDGEEMRAGLLLFHQTLWLHGKALPFCWAQLPLSEGLIDRKYAFAIVQLVKSAIAYQPRLMVLGVGSLDEDWSRFMLKMGWKGQGVPFFFCPLQGSRFLHGLHYFKTRPKWRLAAQIARYSGLGFGLSRYVELRHWLAYKRCSFECYEETRFGPWADELFTTVKDDYGALAQRDSAVLNIIYPPDDQRFIRLRIRRADNHEDLGWIVVIHTKMRDNAYFGNLHVGTLVDGLARPEHVPALINAGVHHLKKLGVDLIVANWSHSAWTAASRQAGFFHGPTNYYFFTAPGGAPLLSDDCPLTQIHVTRGDCDGPAHLLSNIAPGDR